MCEKMAELWRTHWHCILPVAGIWIALFVMWVKDHVKHAEKKNQLSEGAHYEKK